MAGRPWTDKEIEKLKKDYPFKGALVDLPGRSVNAVQEKAGELRVKFEGETVLEKRTDDEKGLLKKKLLAYVKGKQKSLDDICSYLDKGPTTIKTLLQELQDAHYNVAVTNEDQTVILHQAPSQGGGLTMDVEKYFGSSREVSFGVISDLHYCNVHSREELIKLQYDIFKKEGVEIVFECGNMIDGEIYFNRYELLATGIDGQIQYLIKHAPQVKGVTTYFITGDDHEGWLAHSIGLNIGKKIEDDMVTAGRNDWRYLGFMESDVSFKTSRGETVIRLSHPGGGTAYAISYTLQKIIESLQGGEKPHVYLSGHYHKLGYWMVRNIHTMLVGCMQDQTTFARKKHIEFQLGAWIIRMTLGPNGTILKFRPEIYPYFDRKIYAVNTEFNMPGLELAEKKRGREVPAKVF